MAAGFNFGECQTGERVDHVILPPWAKDDRRLFVLKHRQVYIVAGPDMLMYVCRNPTKYYFLHLLGL